ncbi:type II secretion system protein GspK [Dyella sp.]|uniref:general secretion pathway protein GspK n=1 Tax=Dyella sp. TaxID=1869338 RepID=UPI002ED27198
MVRQRGVALLVVMWALTLLSIMLGGYALMARTEGLQARYQFAQTQAHYAAEAGVMRAIYGLQDNQPQTHWISDGRIYAFPYDGAKVQVSMVDEAGKVDLNAASPDVLLGLLRAVGVDDTQGRDIVQHIVDWRSFGTGPGDAAQRAQPYQAAGRDYGPRGGPFASVEEVQMVLGMTPAIYAKISGVLTIWSGRNSPDPATAPPLALAAIPNMDQQQIANILASRQSGQPQNGVQGLGGFQGVTHSIRSEAILADGTHAVLNATVRLQGVRFGAQPYAVLRWKEGDGQ